MGQLPSVDHRNHDHSRQLRVVPGIVLFVLAVPADHFDDGTQRRNRLASQGAQDGSGQGMSTIEIISSFSDETHAAHAIENLRAAQVADFHTFSPIPSHKIEHAIGKKKSPVRWIVLMGGISGILTGLAITIGTTYEWRLNAGGKPLLSWPPFIIICFELMVLLGGIFGIAGFIFFA